MRLIDADAFKEYICNAYEQVKHMYPDGGEWARQITEDFCKDIDEQPTIEPHPTQLTDEDKETIRIHLSAFKERLCNQHRWNEAKEYEELISRLLSTSSAQPDLDEWCTDCKEYDKDKHCCPRWNRVIREALKDVQPREGKWIDYSDEGFIECPFCHSATNCDGNKDELHYCFSCGAELR